ncbi:MAG: hypothetical protein Q7R39_05515, partial [Dehalococcoidia bacterium]|nr:hypothetical protein [Dehalococcoidia bacterium]
MDMRKLVMIYLLLDTFVVGIIGIFSFHGEHGGWDFFLVNGVRLGVMGVIVALWRAGTGSKWLERVLFGKKLSQD